MSVMIHRAYDKPDPTTFGNVGDLRIDLTDNTVYRCTRTITNCDDYGFVKVYQRKGVNTTYVWETVAAEDVLTYILVDEDGNEVPAVLVDRETVFTATANDIRKGAVAATGDGVTVGTKEIPAYITAEGAVVIPVGSVFAIPMVADKCEYTKLQALICDFNTSFSDSVATTKVSINNSVYNVNSTEVLSSVTSNTDNGVIDLGISNDGSNICILRYFTYKEEY